MTGLREAHAHIVQHGRAMSMLRLEDCTSAAECVQRVAERALALGAREWVLGIGLRVEGWERQVWPTAATEPRWRRERVRLAGAKMFADGTLNARTAWMLTPYADPLPGLARGEAILTQGQLEAALARTASMGLELAVHAIGDAAVRRCLDAFEATRTGRLRIEHAEVIDESDVPRFAKLGVVCSVQPCHLLADIEALRRGLPHRLERVLPLRELIDSGCRAGELLWFGSDTPIVRPDPGDSIQAAVHRRRKGMSDGIASGQAIREEEAWEAFKG